MKYFFILSSFLLFLSSNSNAQDNLFEQGFVIMLNGDTIKSMVKQSSSEKLLKNCVVKGADGSEKVYSPWEIKGYGFEKAAFYSSGIVDSSFVEVLVYGELNAYKRGSDYFLKSGTDVGMLQTKIISYTRDGLPVKAKSTKWIGVINFFIKDCKVVDYDLQRKKLSDKLITGIVIAYNQCKGSEYIEYKKEQKWTSFKVGAAVYYTPSTFRVNTEAYPAFAESYSTNSISYGLAFNIYSPRISKRLVYQQEILHTRARYNADLFRNISTRVSAYSESIITISTISLPVSFKYMIPKEKFSLYLIGGANIDFNYERKIKSINEVEVGILNEVEVYTDIGAPFAIDATTIGFNAGVGISKALKKVRSDFLIRYQFTPLRGSITEGSNLSRLNVGFLFFSK